MIERFPDFETPIRQLFALANGSFEPRMFREACEQFATFDAEYSDDALWRFTLGTTVMVVAVETEPTGASKPNGSPEHLPLSISCAILTLCLWDTFAKSDHENVQTWQKEREEFDQFFSYSLARSIEVIGPPQFEGADTDEHRHRYAIWRGQTGLLILQQSAYDPQFGLDVNFWVQPWSGPDPMPASPLIYWLCQQLA